MAGHGKHLQVIGKVMAHNYGLLMAHRSIVLYRTRLVASIRSSTKAKDSPQISL